MESRDRETHVKAHQVWLLAVGVCALTVAACSGSSDSGHTSSTNSAMPPIAQTSAYAVTSLVSDGAVPADNMDKDLKNPWGIAFDPLGPTWLADNGSNFSTLYIDLGIKFPITVSIPAGSNGPAQPTGIVYNNSLSGFKIGKAGAIGKAQFIFSGESGTISAWSELTLSNLDMGAETVYDDGPGGAVYTGLAIAKNDSGSFLYATDFHNAKIDVFDQTFKKITSVGNFADPALPTGYAPFGIQAIGDLLYVTYASQQGPANQHEMVGSGLGLVDLFDANGTLMRRVTTGGPLNAPWGIAMAPANFGQFSKDLLIGNFGDGTINAFDPVTGQFIDSLRDASGKPLSISGLWGIAFGNSPLAVSNWLYFAAGINDRADGLYGRITESTVNESK
ncbi:MAG: hypothetical protein JWR16_1715 [Nevskia sp.]|nr:hypothetical protein [Nevskia sp.]